jgi:hypothetical protein
MSTEFLLMPFLLRRKHQHGKMLLRVQYDNAFPKKVSTTELSMSGLMSAIEPTS